MSHPAFDQLLEAFACYAGLSAEALHESAEIAIDTTTVSLYAESISPRGGEAVDLIMFCTLNVPPQADEANVHRTALEANMLWAGTGGATLGLQPGTGALTLCSRFDIATLNAEELSDRLGRFVDTAECWANYIRARHVVSMSPEIEGLSSAMKAWA